MIVNIISARRAQNVPKMLALARDLDTRWWVDEKSISEYHDAGAPWLAPTWGGVSGARNAALEYAVMRGEDICIQLDDDLTKIHWMVRGVAEEVPLATALSSLVNRLSGTDFKLAGIAPTNNPYFSKNKKSSTTLFVNGSCIAVALPSVPRFDEGFKLKEDYDFCLQHFQQYGGCFRADDILMTFDHRKQQGGAVTIRTPEKEQEAIAMLKAKWGSWVQDNPRRVHEVLLKIPRRKKEVW